MSVPPPSPPPPSVHKTLPKSLTELIFTTLSIFNPKPTSTSTKNHHNRFSKFPYTPIKHHNFPTPKSLSDWLQPRLPSDSFATWGSKPGTKNVHNLWIEINEGETSLADSTPPVRTLEVVVVRILDGDNRILIESHQELSNGDVRHRCRPLSEKMKPGESVEEAVVRGVKEELGSVLLDGDNGVECFDIVEILAGSYSNRVEEKVSVSYPGLPACYILHTVDARVHGLPDTEFCTVEDLMEEDHEEGEEAVSCKKHYWKWVDSNTFSS